MLDDSVCVIWRKSWCIVFLITFVIENKINPPNDDINHMI